MIRYVVTESVHFEDPDKQYLDTAEGTVCGVFNKLSDARTQISCRSQTPLFKGYEDFVTSKSGDELSIDVPGYMHAEWRIHEWDDESDERVFWLYPM